VLDHAVRLENQATVGQHDGLGDAGRARGDAGPGKHHHVLQRWQPIANARDLGQLTFVADHHDFGRRVLEDINALFHCAGRVDRRRYRTDTHGAEVQVVPLRAVAGKDRDVVAALDAQRSQPEPGRAHQLFVALPGHFPPLARLFVAQGDPLRAFVGVVGQDLDDRIRWLLHRCPPQCAARTTKFEKRRLNALKLFFAGCAPHSRGNSNLEARTVLSPAGSADKRMPDWPRCRVVDRHLCNVCKFEKVCTAQLRDRGEESLERKLRYLLWLN